MELTELTDSLEHGFVNVGDGTVRGVRVSVVAGGGITVWAGILDPDAVSKTSRDIAAADFIARTVVHFVSWPSVQGYYANTPFASLIDSIRQRTLRFSTFPSSVVPDSGPD